MAAHAKTEGSQPSLDTDTQGREGAPPIWDTVAASGYARPERPTSEAVRTGLLGLFKRADRDDGPAEPVVAAEGLIPLSADLLERAAPWPDWHQVVPALDRALSVFDAPAADSHPITALIGAPYSGIREGLRCWAAQHRWPVVEPPSAERILGQDESWLEALPEDEEGPPILIVELEHCFLRHPLGLAFVRRLLDRVYRSRRKCLIATNSWAWTYLKKAVGIADGIAPPMTFQALDADRLERWFRRLQRFEEPVTFCRADNGSILLTSTTSGDADAEGSVPAARKDFTRLLAGYSRGIAGIAWAVWRRLLGVAASEEVAQRLKEAHGELPGRLLYVRPWSGTHLSSLPSRTELSDLLLLHALLIHGGLPERTLLEILPNGGANGGSLRKLAVRGIVEEHQGYWQVTPLGYPATREALASEGLFVDSF